MTSQIISQGRIQPNTFEKQLDNDTFSLPQGDVIVSFPVWQVNRDALKAHTAKVGLFVDSGQEPEDFADELGHFDLVAINFPVFSDGRGFSIARLLRERYGFEGDIRAIGDVLQDQLFYMTRCGFTSFELREDKDINEALAGFATISETYQSGTDQPEPLFRRR